MSYHYWTEARVLKIRLRRFQHRILGFISDRTVIRHQKYPTRADSWITRRGHCWGGCGREVDVSAAWVCSLVPVSIALFGAVADHILVVVCASPLAATEGDNTKHHFVWRKLLLS